MFIYQINKLGELHKIIIRCVLSTQELKVKEANMMCWYVLKKNTVLQHVESLMFFIIN